jgi:hypothetical protein
MVTSTLLLAVAAYIPIKYLSIRWPARVTNFQQHFTICCTLFHVQVPQFYQHNTFNSLNNDIGMHAFKAKDSIKVINLAQEKEEEEEEEKSN